MKPKNIADLPAYTYQPAHHEAGPSSLKLIELCPSYEKQHKESANQGRDEGSILHDALERGHLLPLDERNHYLKSLFNKVRAVERPLLEGAEAIYREERLDIGKTGDEGHLTFGTADVIAAFPSEQRVLVADYKTGEFEVDDPAVNPQVQAYVLGVFERFEWAETVEAVLISPKQADVMTSHTYKRSRDFDRIRMRLDTIYQRRKEGIITPVPEACRWCAKFSTCPELRKQLLPLAERYASYEGQLSALPKFDLNAMFESPQAMRENAPRISVFLDLMSFMSRYNDAVRDLVKKTMAEEGLELPDYTLQRRDKKVKAPTNDGYLDDDEALRIAIDEFGVSLIDYIRLSGRLRKAVLERAVMGTKVTEEEQLETLIRFRKRIDADNLWDEPAEPEAPGQVLILLRSRKNTPALRFADMIQQHVDEQKEAKSAKGRKAKRQARLDEDGRLKSLAVKAAKRDRGSTYKVDLRRRKVSKVTTPKKKTKQQ